jgi:amidase
VGVAAGYSPISVGSETFGSLVSPATRAALFSLKPTIGTTLTDGIWTLSDKFDAVGGLARSVIDLADITSLLQDKQAKETATDNGYHRFLTGDFQGLRVGFLDPSVWHFPPERCKTTSAIAEQMVSLFLVCYRHPFDHMTEFCLSCGHGQNQPAERGHNQISGLTM